jgi:hypothetical protein
MMSARQLRQRWCTLHMCWDHSDSDRITLLLLGPLSFRNIFTALLFHHCHG